MKKVLLIKIEAPNCYSSMGMVEAFEQAFEEVRSIDWQAVKFNGGRNGLQVLWERIVAECEAFHPDLIFCQFQREILTPDQFKELSEHSFVVNYSEDVREDITWYEQAAPYCLTIFTNMDDCRKFWAKDLAAAYMLVSYNHLWYKPQAKTDKDYGDIVFLGNNFLKSNMNFPLSQERVDMCNFMKEKFGDRFRAYGIGQENPQLNPMQAVEAYNNCKIAITQNHFKREGYMSDRGLNSMGCGAITIHQHFEGIEEMFKPMDGQAAPLVFWWENFTGLERHCVRLMQEINRLDYMFDYRKSMPEYMKRDHSWHNRIKFVKGFIKVTMEDKRKYKIEYP